MIYLAAPYNHADKRVIEYRRKTFFEIDLRMAELGMHTVSPIYKTLMAADIVRKVDLSYQAWEDYCVALMKLCDELHVLMFPEWEKSHGVSEEIELAKKLGLFIHFVDPDRFLERT